MAENLAVNFPSPPRVIGQIKSAASVLADDRGSRLINIYICIYALIEVRMYIQRIHCYAVVSLTAYLPAILNTK